MANAAETEEAAEETIDSPLIDASNRAIKKMVARAKERGYVTYDELNEVLPQDQVSSEQIEDTMTMLSEMGINVIEGDEAEDSSPDEENTGKLPVPVATRKTGESAEHERTGDPVRMYLREMGSIELLSRQGEIEIAKRIEKGREIMIGAICASPLTMRAIVQWRDDLMAERVLLREIIDLNAAFRGPEEDKNESGEEGLAEEKEEEGGKESAEESKADSEASEVALPLTAMESVLKPHVLETFDDIASIYKKVKRLQDLRIQAVLKSETLRPAQEKRYAKLKEELADRMDTVRLNNGRIEELVDQLYGSIGISIPTKDACCVLRRNTKFRATVSSSSTRVANSIRAGCRASGV